MPTPTFLCGAECQIVSSSGNATEHWTLAAVGVSGTIASVTSPIDPKGGSRSYRFRATGTSDTAVLQNAAPSSKLNGVHGRFLATVLANVQVLSLGNANGNGIVSLTSGGQLQVQIGAGTPVNFGPTISINTFYSIDVWFDTSANPAAIKARVNGDPATEGSTTGAQVAANTTTLSIGVVATPTTAVDIHWDNLITTVTLADYPISDGFVLGYVPNAVGTHSTQAAGDFKNDAAANVIVGETTSWSKLTELPADTTSYVEQEVIAATEYLEYVYATGSETGTPIGVEQIVSRTASAAGARTESAQLFDGTTAAAAYTAALNNASLVNTTKQWAVTPSGSAWTNAVFKTLRLRWGFASDVTPKPRLTSTVLEAWFGTVQNLTRTTTEAPTTAEAMARLLTGLRAVTSAPTTAESVARAFTGLRAITDAPHTAETATGLGTKPRSTTDAPHTAEAMTRRLVGLRTTTEAPTTSESLARIFSGARVTTDSPQTSETATQAAAKPRTTTDAPSVALTVARLIAELRTATDAPTTSESAVRVKVTLRTTTDAPTTADVVVRVITLPTFAPRGLTGAVEYVAEIFDAGSSFGPNNKLGEVWEFRNLGWSRYDRLPGKAFATLYQDSPHLSMFSPLLTHIRITRVTPQGDTELYNGKFIDYDSEGDDVVLTFYDYIAELAVSRTGYRTLYPTKYLGTQIAEVEVQAAISALYSPIGFVTMGTVEDPLGQDGVTKIQTNNQFGLLDQMRLQLVYDLSEMGRANTTHHVSFEVTRTSPFTFNFWKDKGSAVNLGLVLNGTVSDYEYLPNWGAYRNDLASLGTTVGGGATEIVQTNETAAAIRSRRQDTATIKTVLGITSSAVETDQQQAATARMLNIAVQKTPALSLQLVQGTIAPFAGWDINDKFPVEIVNGYENLTADMRVVGVRGLYTEGGEDLGLILEPILT